MKETRSQTAAAREISLFMQKSQSENTPTHLCENSHQAPFYRFWWSKNSSVYDKTSFVKFTTKRTRGIKNYARVLHSPTSWIRLDEDRGGGHWPHLNNLTTFFLFQMLNLFHECWTSTETLLVGDGAVNFDNKGNCC